MKLLRNGPRGVGTIHEMLRSNAASLSGSLVKQNHGLFAEPWRKGGVEVKLGIREEERLTEDEIARRKLGPRGVPGGQDFAKMTPQQEKNIPKPGVFDGHTA